MFSPRFGRDVPIGKQAGRVWRDETHRVTVLPDGSDQALLQAMSELELSSQPSEPYEALPVALGLRSWGSLSRLALGR